MTKARNNADNVSGDISEVTAGTGITVSSGTGPAPAVALTTPVASTNGGTGLSSFTTGDIIYSSSGNTLSKLGIGTTSQVLTVASGLPSWAAASGGMTLIKRASFTNVASTTTTFDDVFSSTYGSYQIIFEQIGSVSDYTNDLQMQMRYAGPTTQTSGYQGNVLNFKYDSTTITNTNYGPNSEFILSVNAGQGQTTSGYIIANVKGGANREPVINGMLMDEYEPRSSITSGYLASNRTYTGFLLKCSATNITGTVAVYGMAV